MFNDNETFCYSVDVANELYKNTRTQEEANESFFKHLNLFIQDTGQEFVHSQGKKMSGFERINYKCFVQTISVLLRDSNKAVSSIDLNGIYTRSLFEYASINKCLFGLPIYTISFDGIESAFIRFRTLESYIEYDSPLGRLKNIIKLAEKGYPNSQFELGEKFYYGIDVVQDYEKAAMWWEKAALQGHETAQYNIGQCYEQGLGVKQNYTLAFNWYQKAASQGDIDAITNVGLYYYLGRGCYKDYREAVKWWEKAANLGNDKAIYNLGICYRDGTGIHQNLVKAKELFIKAKELGHHMASKALDDLWRIYSI
jgi:hypothetical protein